MHTYIHIIYKGRMPVGTYVAPEGGVVAPEGGVVPEARRRIRHWRETPVRDAAMSSQVL